MKFMVFLPLAMALMMGLPAHAAVITEDEREVLRHTIFGACYGKAKQDAEYQALNKQHHADVAETYCECMAVNMANAAADEEAIYAAEHEKMAPSLEAKIVLNSRECRNQATLAEQ